MTTWPRGYWPNVRAVLSLAAHNAERIQSAIRAAEEVAVLGDCTDDLHNAKLDAALRDLDTFTDALFRVIPSIHELTRAARSVSSAEADE